MNTPIKILVLGGSSFIGKAIIAELTRNDAYDLYATWHSYPIQSELKTLHPLHWSLESLDTWPAALERIASDFVISCLRGPFDLQLRAHALIADYLKHHGGKMVFISTANVYDADFSRSYIESDPPRAQSDYGLFKIQCEEVLKEALDDRLVVLRLPQVWGIDSPRMHQLNDLLKGAAPPPIFPNLYITITTDTLVARAISAMVPSQDHPQPDFKGIYHLGSTDAISYSAFYYQLISALGQEDLARTLWEEDDTLSGNFSLATERENELEAIGQKYTSMDVIEALTSTHNL